MADDRNERPSAPASRPPTTLGLTLRESRSEFAIDRLHGPEKDLDVGADPLAGRSYRRSRLAP